MMTTPVYFNNHLTPVGLITITMNNKHETIPKTLVIITTTSGGLTYKVLFVDTSCRFHYWFIHMEAPELGLFCFKGSLEL